MVLTNKKPNDLWLIHQLIKLTTNECLGRLSTSYEMIQFLKNLKIENKLL